MIFRLMAGTAVALLVSGCCFETETYLEYRYANATDDTLTLLCPGQVFPLLAPDTLVLPPNAEQSVFGGLGFGKQSAFHPAFYYADSALDCSWTSSSGADVTVSPADSSAWAIERVEERCVVTFRCLLRVGPEDLVP